MNFMFVELFIVKNIDTRGDAKRRNDSNTDKCFCEIAGYRNKTDKNGFVANPLIN